MCDRLYTTNYKGYNNLKPFLERLTLALKAASLSVEETITLSYLEIFFGEDKESVNMQTHQTSFKRYSGHEL